MPHNNTKQKETLENSGCVYGRVAGKKDIVYYVNDIELSLSLGISLCKY